MQRFLSLQNDRHPLKYSSHSVYSDFETGLLICCSEQICCGRPSIFGVLFYLHTHIFVWPTINTHFARCRYGVFCTGAKVTCYYATVFLRMLPNRSAQFDVIIST